MQFAFVYTIYTPQRGGVYHNSPPLNDTLLFQFFQTMSFNFIAHRFWNM